MILTQFWTGILISSIPSIIGLAIYMVRLEVKLTKIADDVSWINKRCSECQHGWARNTQ